MKSIDIILSFIKDNKKLFFVYFSIILLTYPLESIAISNIFGKIYDRFSMKITNQNLDKIQYLFFIIIGIWIFIGISKITKSYLFSRIVPTFYKYVRNVFFERIILRYQRDFKELRLGHVISTFAEGPWAFYSSVNQMLGDYLPSSLTLIAVICYLFYLKPKFGLIALIALLLLITIVLIIEPQCIDLSHTNQATITNNNELIQDKLSNLFSIYTSNSEKQEIMDQLDREVVLENTLRKTIRCNDKIQIVINIVVALLFISFSYMLFTDYKNKALPANVLISISIMTTYFFTYLNDISDNISFSSHLLGIIRNTDSFLKELEISPKILQKEQYQKKINIEKGEISFQNVSFQYVGVKEKLLDKVSFVIKPKDNFAIIGRSGSGKTTIIKLLLGFYDCQEGKIMIDNIGVEEMDITHLRSQISYVDQNVKLFNSSIWENIRYGNNASFNEIRKTMIEYGLEHVFSNKPDGLHSNVGVNGTNLSKGQRQVVSIMRAILRPSKIIILDEPTSALDKNTKSIILGIIKKMKGKKTCIIITHDQDVLPFVSQTYKMITL